MAYPVSNKFREMVYSGNSLYTTSLKINNLEISDTQIETITISNPIIDSEEDYFYIGTFISQQLKIKFRNMDGLNLHSGDLVTFDMGICIDEENETYKTIPIGKYLIDDLAEDYKTKCEITCLDYAVKFKSNVDYSKLVKDGSKVTLKNLLIWLCNYFDVRLGTYPNVNNDVETNLYDNTVSGKRYISYIAEMFGGNAKIDRDGKLNIVPLKQEPVVTIDAEQGKTWNLKEKYEISGVTWFDAIRRYDAGNDTRNVLFIRSDNMFVSEKNQIDNIFNAVNGFSVYSLEEENVADISLDAWDTIRFEYEGNYYSTLNNNEIIYATSLMTKINTIIPTEAQEATTNIVGTEEAKYRRLKTTVDYDNNQIQLIASEIGDRVGKKSTITEDIDYIRAQVSEIADITTSDKSDKARVELNNINTSQPVHIDFNPLNQNVAKIYPNRNCIIGPNLILRKPFIRFHNTVTNEDFDYYFIEDLYYYNDDIYDEFHLDYETHRCYSVKRCQCIDNIVSQLSEEKLIEHPYPEEELNLTDGDYLIYIYGYSSGTLFVRLMASNIYTSQFATKVELNAEINVSANKIYSTVSGTYYKQSDASILSSRVEQAENSITSEVRRASNSEGELSSRITQTDSSIRADVNQQITGLDGKINNVSGQIELKIGRGENDQIVSMLNASANEINLSGNRFVLTSDNFKVDKNGNITATGGSIGGFALGANEFKTTYNWPYRYTISDAQRINQIYLEIIAPTADDYAKYDLNGDGVINLLDQMIVLNLINGKTSYGSTFTLNTKTPEKVLYLVDDKGNKALQIGTMASYFNNLSVGRNIQLNGSNGNIDTTGVITCQSINPVSNEKYKKNIEKFEKGLEVVKSTDIYKYNYKTEDDTYKKHIGFVIGGDYNYSHEITSNDNDKVDLYSMASVCFQAIKEQQKQIEELKKEIQILKEMK